MAPPLLTIAEIKRRISDKHGDTLTVDELTYKNTKTKARFIDKDFGEYWAVPGEVMKGHGHLKRGFLKRNKSLITPVNTVREMIFKIHGDLITIDENTYNGTNKKSHFMDRDYGEWESRVTDIIAGRGHPKRGNLRMKAKKTFTPQEISKRIEEIHGDTIKLDEKSYLKTNIKARFEDKRYGEFWALPVSVLSGHSPLRKLEKMTNTMLERYGVKNPSESSTFINKAKETLFKRTGFYSIFQNPDKALEMAKKKNDAKIFFHWGTKEELVCTASYEQKTVQYWNDNQEDFRWQIVFKIPENEPLIGGKTYRVDAYLPNKDIYVEIKGRFYDEEARLKWEWFHRTYPNSELWDKPKLKSLGIL